jgi:Icc-related predicted phosphoesterase
MIEIILEMLKTLKKPILALPGNLDGSESIELFKKKGINLHGKGIKINDVGFYGYGGARTPFNTPLEPSEGELEIGLEKSYREVADCEVKVQVTHMPPNGTKIDLLYTGAHAGSDVVRNFILKKKPKVAISAHIHEARGIDELEGTKLINSGRFPEGYCGIVKVGMKNIEAKIINLI